MTSEQEIRYEDITKRINYPIVAAIIMLAETLAAIDFTKPSKPDK